MLRCFWNRLMFAFVLFYFSINNLVRVMFGSSNALHIIYLSLIFVTTSCYNCKVKIIRCLCTHSCKNVCNMWLHIDSTRLRCIYVYTYNSPYHIITMFIHTQHMMVMYICDEPTRHLEGAHCRNHEIVGLREHVCTHAHTWSHTNLPYMFFFYARLRQSKQLINPRPRWIVPNTIFT